LVWFGWFGWLGRKWGGEEEKRGLRGVDEEEKEGKES
jgi:hypothetical protein